MTYGPAERILRINPVNPVNPVKNNNCLCSQSKIIQNSKFHPCRPFRAQFLCCLYSQGFALGYPCVSASHSC